MLRPFRPIVSPLLALGILTGTSFWLHEIGALGGDLFTSIRTLWSFQAEPAERPEGLAAPSEAGVTVDPNGAPHAATGPSDSSLLVR